MNDDFKSDEGADKAQGPKPAKEPKPAQGPKPKEPRGPRAKFRVTVRHSPAPVKKLDVEARDEDEAWERYVEALVAKGFNEAGLNSCHKSIVKLPE